MIGSFEMETNLSPVRVTIKIFSNKLVVVHALAGVPCMFRVVRVIRRKLDNLCRSGQSIQNPEVFKPSPP